MKFNYIYGKQAEQYDYLYIPKAFMKEEFKSMRLQQRLCMRCSWRNSRYL